MTAQKLQILVVEDNLLNQFFLSKILRREGHEITTARTGREAVTKFRPGHFDLILMDIEMPEMNGIVAMKRIRELETDNTVFTPIIAMTGYSEKRDYRRCIESGADAVLQKPLNAAILLTVIKDLVQGMRDENNDSR